jgi:hypothetical protein
VYARGHGAHIGGASCAKLRVLKSLRSIVISQTIGPLYDQASTLSAGRIDEATNHAREALALSRSLGARGYEAGALCLER